MTAFYRHKAPANRSNPNKITLTACTVHALQYSWPGPVAGPLAITSCTSSVMVGRITLYQFFTLLWVLQNDVEIVFLKI